MDNNLGTIVSQIIERHGLFGAFIYFMVIHLKHELDNISDKLDKVVEISNKSFGAMVIMSKMKGNDHNEGGK